MPEQEPAQSSQEGRPNVANKEIQEALRQQAVLLEQRAKRRRTRARKLIKQANLLRSMAK